MLALMFPKSPLGVSEDRIQWLSLLCTPLTKCRGYLVHGGKNGNTLWYHRGLTDLTTREESSEAADVRKRRHYLSCHHRHRPFGYQAWNSTNSYMNKNCLGH
mmetsp:Transcript_17553/g.25624  ORF Transcript_17553/g.25624 Transcript_17553/m.25624 type:complete len:102 (-) Transcript_17553:474-779(-)